MNRFTCRANLSCYAVTRGLLRLRVLLALLFAQGCSTSDDTRNAADNVSASAARNSASSDQWVYRDLPLPNDSAPGSGTFELVEVARFGSEDGPGWIAEINSAAVSDSVVAISSSRACEIVLFSRHRRGQMLGRFGQCGEGPDDFREIGAIALAGDTVLVTDHRGRRLQFVTFSGRIIRTVAFDTVAVPALSSGIARFSRWSDSLLVISVRLPSHGGGEGNVIPREEHSPYVRVVPISGAGRRFESLVDGHGVARVNYGQQRNTAACVAGAYDNGDPPMLIALNRWRPQLAVIRLPMRPANQPIYLGNRVLKGVPIGASDGQSPPPKMRPFFSIACADSLAVGAYQVYGSSDRRVTLSTDAYLIAVSPFTGRHSVMHVSDTLSAALGTVMAAHGNSFFFAHNGRFDYPQLVEMKVKLR